MTFDSAEVRKGVDFVTRSTIEKVGIIPVFFVFLTGDRFVSSLVFEQETPELIRTRRVPELSQCLGLDLPDAFAGNVELFADFL